MLSQTDKQENLLFDQKKKKKKDEEIGVCSILTKYPLSTE